MTTHLQTHGNTTLCGQKIKDLVITDPLGYVILLALMQTIQTNDDQLTIRFKLDSIANRADCPKCREIYATQGTSS